MNISKEQEAIEFLLKKYPENNGLKEIKENIDLRISNKEQLIQEYSKYIGKCYAGIGGEFYRISNIEYNDVPMDAARNHGHIPISIQVYCLRINKNSYSDVDIQITRKQNGYSNIINEDWYKEIPSDFWDIVESKIKQLHTDVFGFIPFVEFDELREKAGLDSITTNEKVLKILGKQ